jgi:hypothetical protein
MLRQRRQHGSDRDAGVLPQALGGAGAADLGRSFAEQPAAGIHVALRDVAMPLHGLPVK